MLGAPYNFWRGDTRETASCRGRGYGSGTAGYRLSGCACHPDPSQVDELTAGAIVLISISSASSRSEVEGEGTAAGSAAASASLIVEAPASGSDVPLRLWMLRPLRLSPLSCRFCRVNSRPAKLRVRMRCPNPGARRLECPTTMSYICNSDATGSVPVSVEYLVSQSYHVWAGLHRCRAGEH
jgi:hypothetical protein